MTIIVPKKCFLCGSPAKVFHEGYECKVTCSNPECRKSLVCTDGNGHEDVAIDLWNKVNKIKGSAKPCPFCGHRAELDEKENIHVRCGNSKCFVRVETYHYYPMEALQIWNTRNEDTNCEDDSAKMDGKDDHLRSDNYCCRNAVQKMDGTNQKGDIK